MDEHPVTIKGQCAQCHHIYILDDHNHQCPQCSEVGLLWATNVTQAKHLIYVNGHGFTGRTLPTVDNIREKLGYTRSEAEIRDIEMLEHMFGLEDTRGNR